MKKLISAILAIAMMLSICTVLPVSAENITKSWEFNTAGSNEGWAAQKGSLVTANGVMTHTVSAGNNNAFLLSPNNLGIDGSKYKYVKIKLKNNNVASTACVVSFVTTANTSWDTSYSSGTKSVVQTPGITGYDSEFKEYVIDMSGNSNWTSGTITRFRLLVALNSTSITAGSMDIDYIRVSDTLETRNEKTFYVSSSAANGGDGTENAPWRSLDDVEEAMANGEIIAGDTILLERGSVFNENFVPTVSGNSEKWITVSAYGEGARPKIAPGQDAMSPYAIYLEDVYGYKFTGLEITDARVGIRMINRSLNTETPDGLYVENCFIHNIHGIEAPKYTSDINAGSEYLETIEDIELYTSYGIQLYKVLGNSNKSFNNVTIKDSCITDTGAPLNIYYANNVAIDNCEFSNSYNTGVFFSNVSDSTATEATGSYMKNCKIFNMGYNGGMPWGIAGVQFNSCNYFTMSDCDVMYTQVGGGDHITETNTKPDGIAIDYEGANQNIAVDNCNLVGNMDSAFLVMQNEGWAKDKPNQNSDITNNFMANNRLRTIYANTRTIAFMRMGASTQDTTSGDISGNTIVKRNGQKVAVYNSWWENENISQVTDDITEIPYFTIGDNTVIATESDATITTTVSGTPNRDTAFNVSLASDKTISAEKTEIYLNTEVAATVSGFPSTVSVTPDNGGVTRIMAKVTLTNGDTIYSDPISVNVAGDITFGDTITEEEDDTTENFAYEWVFDSSVNGWFSNRASKTGGKALYIENGSMVYYLSEDSSASANTNNFLLSPNGLSIDGSKYKYVKIRLKNTTNLNGNLGVMFTTTDNTSFQSSWLDTTYTKQIVGAVSANDEEFKEYVLDMSDVPNWVNSTITRLRVVTNAYTIGEGNSGDILIEYIKISDKAVTPEEPEIVVEEEYGQKWLFSEGVLGFASNKGSREGSKPLYVNNGTLEYYLSDDSSASANSNNYIVTPANLAIDGSKYKYVKVKMRSELPVKGDFGVRFTTTDGNTMPSSWSDTEYTVQSIGTVTADDKEFKEYVLDMSGCANWVNGTITRMQIKLNPYTINGGEGGTVHIVSIGVSNVDTLSEPTSGVIYDWDFDITDNADAWQSLNNERATVSQKDGKLVFNYSAWNAALLSPVNAPFEGAKYPYVHIIMKNETGTANRQKLLWTTDEETSFETTNKAIDKTWEDKDGYVHYVYDMSDNEYWNGKTVTRFQFYPAANASSGSVSIDRIIVSGDPAIMYDDNTITFSKDTEDYVSCKVVLKQDYSAAAKGVIALYDERGAMIDAEVTNLAFDKNTQTVNELSIAVPEDKAVASAKAFVWDDLMSMIPIVDSKVKYVGLDSLSAYAVPYHEGNVMINESLTMIKGEDGEAAEAPLYYTPTEIISVRNSALNIEYVEGVDYTIDGNVLKLTDDSSIFAFDYTDIYPTKAGTDIRKNVDGGYINCTEGAYFHNGQIAVTYKHEEDTDFVGQTYQGDKLSNMFSKLESNETVNVLLYGDSISTGANMSGKCGVAPWLPVYGQMWADVLEAKYGTQVNFANISKAGQTSAWGAENAESLISGKNPDVLIIAFGMNDGTFGNTLDQYKTNTESIINTAKTLYPDCEIVLVSTTLPNEKVYRADGVSLFLGNHREQPAVLEEIAEDTNAVFVNVTKVHDKLLENKRFVDMTGNNTNHPNDFLGRVYLQALMEATVE